MECTFFEGISLSKQRNNICSTPSFPPSLPSLPPSLPPSIPDQDQFRFHRTGFYSSLKSKVGLISATAADLRVNMEHRQLPDSLAYCVSTPRILSHLLPLPLFPFPPLLPKTIGTNNLFCVFDVFCCVCVCARARVHALSTIAD